MKLVHVFRGRDDGRYECTQVLDADRFIAVMEESLEWSGKIGKGRTVTLESAREDYGVRV